MPPGQRQPQIDVALTGGSYHRVRSPTRALFRGQDEGSHLYDTYDDSSAPATSKLKKQKAEKLARGAPIELHEKQKTLLKEAIESTASLKEHPVPGMVSDLTRLGERQLESLSQNLIALYKEKEARLERTYQTRMRELENPSTKPAASTDASSTDDMQQRIQELESQLKQTHFEKDKEIQSLHEQLSESKYQEGVLKGRLNRVEESDEQLLHNEAELKASANQLQLPLTAELEREHEAMEAERQEHETTREALRRAEQQARELEHSDSELLRVQEELRIKNDEVANLREQLNEAEDQVNLHYRARRRATEAADNHRRSSERMQTELEAARQTCDTLRGEKVKLQTEITTKERSLLELSFTVKASSKHFNIEQELCNPAEAEALRGELAALREKSKAPEIDHGPLIQYRSWFTEIEEQVRDALAKDQRSMSKTQPSAKATAELRQSPLLPESQTTERQADMVERVANLKQTCSTLFTNLQKCRGFQEKQSDSLRRMTQEINLLAQKLGPFYLRMSNGLNIDKSFLPVRSTSEDSVFDWPMFSSQQEILAQIQDKTKILLDERSRLEAENARLETDGDNLERRVAKLRETCTKVMDMYRSGTGTLRERVKGLSDMLQEKDQIIFRLLDSGGVFDEGSFSQPHPH